MFNRSRTKEVFGYDIDPNKRSRRSDEEFKSTNGCLKKHLQVIDNCPVCNTERQIQYRASKKNKPCYTCFHNSPEMRNAKRNQNKTKSEETKKKMKENHWSTRGLNSPFKGKSHSNSTRKVLSDIARKQSDCVKDQLGKEEYAIVMACMSQKIKRDDFKEFTTPIGVAIRQSPEGKAWTYDVLAKANFTCQKCNAKGGSLHAHHLNGFNLFPEQRFNTNNGVCLCENCHSAFHDAYGRGNNTKHQYDEWSNIDSKPTVYLLIGAPGAGKSWIAEQVKNNYDYISFDDVPKKEHIEKLKVPSSKHKLYDPTFKISTLIKRHSHELNFIIATIQEEEDTLRTRINSRGGKWTDTIMKRNNECKKRFIKYNKDNKGFIGNANEVLSFLLREDSKYNK